MSSAAVVGGDRDVVIEVEGLVKWLGVVAAFALTILGPLFRLWDWALGISPLRHVPNLTTTPGWSGLALVASSPSP
ncbi:hypothetical protein SAMN05444365_10744 [Micromonospora pattaloongensis]|uniref:Uncharacterized protein n=1 Tax=Micromonospora pattaloongensis TaxID=405436 RepID=A0A1H3R3J6_9ACTN|nr:hypothetical protein [Micromonospora pattaloongensis]SDZ20402.1 hypothetical protein SAMN05444365_10744 [Micromonospora pattaloongensis]